MANQFFIHSLAFEISSRKHFTVLNTPWLLLELFLHLYSVFFFHFHCSPRNNKWKFLLRELKSNDLLDINFRCTPIRHNNFYTQSFLFISTQFQLNLLTLYQNARRSNKNVSLVGIIGKVQCTLGIFTLRKWKSEETSLEHFSLILRVLQLSKKSSSFHIFSLK